MCCDASVLCEEKCGREAMVPLIPYHSLNVQTGTFPDMNSLELYIGYYHIIYIHTHTHTHTHTTHQTDKSIYIYR
jgi:hypothetical protein